MPKSAASTPTSSRLPKLLAISNRNSPGEIRGCFIQGILLTPLELADSSVDSKEKRDAKSLREAQGILAR
jgi:hypothetical protein